MNKIEAQLKKIKKEARLGLMTHVVVGYPSLTQTFNLVKTMEKSGADFVELQIPFSDPLADGPTIMRACETALERGVKVKDSFTLMRRLTKEVSIPLFFMAYFNTIFTYGTERFCRDAKKAGASGLVVPDMPIEEERSERFIKLCKKYNLANIRTISPSSTNRRIKLNAAVASGFMYATVQQGVTGSRKTLDSHALGFLKRVRRECKMPLAVGFGISTKDQIQSLSQYADIIVVGSAIIDVINRSHTKNMQKNVSSFIKRLDMLHLRRIYE